MNSLNDSSIKKRINKRNIRNDKNSWLTKRISSCEKASILSPSIRPQYKADTTLTSTKLIFHLLTFVVVKDPKIKRRSMIRKMIKGKKENASRMPSINNKTVCYKFRVVAEIILKFVTIGWTPITNFNVCMLIILEFRLGIQSVT